jgi:hypothetical protein
VTIARNLGAFEGCPACGTDFGTPPSTLPPSLRLDLGAGPAGRKPWRLSLFTETGDIGKSWTSETFAESRTEAVYWLCGDGHLYFDHRVDRNGRQVATWLVEDHDRAAMVGGVAAGKTYLLLRTINQHLMLGPRYSAVTAPLRKLVGDPIEERPLRALKNEYLKAMGQGIPLSRTGLQSLMPRWLLAETIGDDLVEQILAIHAELGVADHDPDAWGNQVRQPIVQRYNAAGKKVLTSIADLPGEFYNAAATDDSNQPSKLKGYSNLLWVVDPIVVPEFEHFLPADDRHAVTMGSVRPDGDIESDLKGAVVRRNAQQSEIANLLANDEQGIGQDAGRTQQVLVCFTKADLLALALRDGRALSELGRHRAVVDGVMDYLIHVANRSGRSADDRYVEDLAWNTVIGEVAEARHETRNRDAIAAHLAQELVRHYSDGERLWNLVHDGDEDEIEVPAGKLDILVGNRIPVPSIDEHVASALVPGQAGVLRQRDLIMSALTCGLVYGLNLRGPVYDLLDQHWRDVRFFLCSPFGEVPVSTAEHAGHFKLLKGNSFPPLDAPSAALVQIHLTLVAGVRP